MGVLGGDGIHGGEMKGGTFKKSPDKTATPGGPKHVEYRTGGKGSLKKCVPSRRAR